MSDQAQLGFSLERLMRMIEERSSNQGKRAATIALAGVASNIMSAIAEHTSKRRYVHGTGPFYVAKTRNSNQFVDWSEIENKPDKIEAIDDTEIVIDANQVATGTMDLTRLPVAGPGEASNEKLLLSNDPRLSAHYWTMTVGEPLQAGMFVAPYNDNGVEKIKPASSSSWETCAIGFVSEAWGTGDEAKVFPVGINDFVYLPDVVISDIGKTVFLNSTGFVTLNTSSVVVVQPLGSIVGVASSTLAKVLVRYELRILIGA